MIMSPYKGEGGNIGFSVDPVGVGVRVSVGVRVTDSCTLDISLEPVDGIPPNLPGYIIGTNLRAD